MRDVLTSWAAVDAEGLWSARLETWLAVLLHDAVYVPGATDNEARSAERVPAFVDAFDPRSGGPPDVARIQRLISLTARHGALTPADVSPDEALFLDCDLVIVAASPERFSRYDEEIRAEYAPIVPPEALDAGRRAFLASLLDRSRIFLSDRFHALHDADARSNLRRQLGRRSC